MLNQLTLCDSNSRLKEKDLIIYKLCVKEIERLWISFMTKEDSLKIETDPSF